MKPGDLGVGVQIWIIRRYDREDGVKFVDGPFLVVAYDRKMVYAVRDASTSSGEFFPVEEIALEREVAEENLERSKSGQ